MRELDSEDGVDTLGRWMAHHIAELLHKVENVSSEAERVRARKSAVDAILKVWEHRATLPGRAYPLAAFKEIVPVLERLSPDANPFFAPHGSKREQLAEVLFDKFPRLIMALLAMKLPTDVFTTELNVATIEALDETEQVAFHALWGWGEFLRPAGKSRERARKGNSDGTESKVNLEEAALRLIDNISTTLDKLKSDLQEQRPRLTAQRKRIGSKQSSSKGTK